MVKFELKKLPYDYKDLDPVISEKTLHFHHDKHHQAYLDKFNAALEDLNVEGLSIEEIFAQVSKYPDSIKNNGGGYWNHNFYFESIIPGGKNPGEAFVKLLDQYFGSKEDFEELFIQYAMTLFGSGWTWLGVRKNGELVIFNTKNQENSLMDVVGEKAKPLIAMDLWEHAYYLDYQNQKANHYKEFMKIINWEKVEERYKKAALNQ